MFRTGLMAAIAIAALSPTSVGHAQEEDAESARTQQILACEEAARLSIDRDRIISRSISGAGEPDPIGGGGGGAGALGSTETFPGELSRFEEERRRRRLVEDCLRRAGIN
ncbi:MAG TPA: hypothetical protein VED46_18270 [Alphaproteobacteria bacterium]|nr:hypothetical protein [Alphaproteobacteria bacterium]